LSDLPHRSSSSSAKFQAFEEPGHLLRLPRAASLWRQSAIVESLGDRAKRLTFAS
jgi:hypothetical protein